MTILCPNCNNTLLSRSDVNKLLPLKKFGLSEVKCSTCNMNSISTPESRGIWFFIFMAVLMLLMVIGKQVVQVTGFSSEAKIIVIFVGCFFVNWLFSYIWPRVITIKLKDS